MGERRKSEVLCKGSGGKKRKNGRKSNGLQYQISIIFEFVPTFFSHRCIDNIHHLIGSGIAELSHLTRTTKLYPKFGNENRKR